MAERLWEQAEELKYMDDPVSPLPSNLTLADLARKLSTGESVIVILEPGDATLYSMLLTPCWADGVGGQLDSFGIPASMCQDYLLVTRFNSGDDAAFFAYPNMQTYDISVNNEWTQILLAWWLRIVWKELEHLR